MPTQQSKIECTGYANDCIAKIFLTQYDKENQPSYYRGELPYMRFAEFCRFARLGAPNLASSEGTQERTHSVVPVDILAKLGFEDVTGDYQTYRTRVVEESGFQAVVNENAKEGYVPHTVSAPLNGKISIVFRHRSAS